MHKDKIRIWEEDEYNYPMAFGFVPHLMTYLHGDGSKGRPGIIVVPGGGYCVVSPTEGEIVAKKFYDMGFQAFVLTYTTNLLMSVPLGKQPMKDLSRAIRYIRRHAEEYYLNPGQLAVCGFSAGGHLCGSICVHYVDVIDENAGYSDYSNRPDAAILAYPVITSGEYAHQDSFKALLGMKYDEAVRKTICTASEKELDYMSLEKHVTRNTPPCFLWQTATDELVPVENSALFAEACKKHNVPYAYHVFSEGQHGLSLADEKWASGEYGEPYTMEQSFAVIEAVKNGSLPMPEDAKRELMAQFDFVKKQDIEIKANKEVEIWPKLAEYWLQEILCCL